MNEEKFDITCTATLRPDLLDRTLSSFTKNLFRERIACARLIINIDYAGVEEEQYPDKLLKIISVVNDYPFYEVVPRYCTKPHFPTAFCWCMDQIKNKYFFHLEEDWELLFPIDFDAMWNLFDRHGDLAHLRLSKFASEEFRCKNWNKFLVWNGEFFEVQFDEKLVIGWAGHPSLNRSSFVQECLPYINRMVNPEKQIKGKIHPCITQSINAHRFGSFHPQNKEPSIKDTGRKWMMENGYKKKGNKAWFVNWEKS